MTSVPERPSADAPPPACLALLDLDDPDDFALVCALLRLLRSLPKPTDSTKPDGATPAKPKRKRSLKPSSIAAFEAQWQAEHADETES